MAQKLEKYIGNIFSFLPDFVLLSVHVTCKCLFYGVYVKVIYLFQDIWEKIKRIETERVKISSYHKQLQRVLPSARKTNCQQKKKKTFCEIFFNIFLFFLFKSFTFFFLNFKNFKCVAVQTDFIFLLVISVESSVHYW